MANKSEHDIELTPDGIARLVTQQELATSDLRARFESDFGLYQLEWTDNRWKDGVKPEGYETYISNEPRTSASRMLSTLVAARLQVRVPFEGKQDEERKQAQRKEQFIIGALRSADGLLLKRMEPTLRGQLAFYITIRGWYAGRVLFVKGEDGSTTIDISPFDPLHTFYGFGPDGLKWLVHRTKRSAQEILDEYGLDLHGGTESPSAGSGGDGDSFGFDVYDYYDETNNAVVVGKEWAKEPSPHFAKRVPCFLGVVGVVPRVQRKAESKLMDSLKMMGESVFADNREVYDNWNKTLSDQLSLVRRSLKRSYLVRSPEGTLTLEGDPNREGAKIPLAEGQNVEPLALAEMAKDTDKLLAVISGEIQRGSLPHSSFGEIQHPISGYAINQLSMHQQLKVEPLVTALEQAYRQIAMLLCEQYASGSFQPVRLNGYLGRVHFNTEFLPNTDVPLAEEMEINVLPRLPKDDITNYSMAQMAREGRRPLVSDRTLRDDTLGLQDPDAEEDLINEQIAQQATPLSMLQTLIESALRRGRVDLATILLDEFKTMMGQQNIGAQPPAGPPGLGVPSTRPEIAPMADLGMPPVPQGRNGPVPITRPMIP